MSSAFSPKIHVGLVEKLVGSLNLVVSQPYTHLITTDNNSAQEVSVKDRIICGSRGKDATNNNKTKATKTEELNSDIEKILIATYTI